MAKILTMPMLGNTMETGVVIEWVVDEGEPISEGDVVIIIESEKTSSEITADRDGVLLSIDVEAGEEVPPGTRLGVIREPDEDPAEVEVGEADAISGDERVEEPEPVSVNNGTDDSEGTTEAVKPEGNRVPAAPGARQRARENDLSLTAIDGTGPEGAVLIADVEGHLETQASSDIAGTTGEGHVVAPPSVRRLARELGVDLGAIEPVSEHRRISESDVRRATGHGAGTAHSQDGDTIEIETADPESEGLTVAERRRLSGMRSTIARRMSQSARQKPHVTLNRKVSAQRALAVVEEYSDGHESIGLTDILVCAAIKALETHPEFNAWFGDGALSLIEEVNIAVAVDIEGGLVTPVLRDAGSKTPTQLARERAELTKLMNEGEYTMADIQGGTFTISNLGMLGVDSFNPIINPPQVAILGVGRIRTGGGGQELTLSLSFDHRVVDGADAARFLDTLAAGVTAPTTLLTRQTEAALENSND